MNKMKKNFCIWKLLSWLFVTMLLLSGTVLADQIVAYHSVDKACTDEVRGTFELVMTPAIIREGSSGCSLYFVKENGTTGKESVIDSIKIDNGIILDDVYGFSGIPHEGAATPDAGKDFRRQLVALEKKTGISSEEEPVTILLVSRFPRSAKEWTEDRFKDNDFSWVSERILKLLRENPNFSIVMLNVSENEKKNGQLFLDEGIMTSIENDPDIETGRFYWNCLAYENVADIVKHISPLNFSLSEVLFETNSTDQTQTAIYKAGTKETRPWMLVQGDDIYSVKDESGQTIATSSYRAGEYTWVVFEDAVKNAQTVMITGEQGLSMIPFVQVAEFTKPVLDIKQNEQSEKFVRGEVTVFVTAGLDEIHPDGLDLSIELEAPDGNTSTLILDKTDKNNQWKANTSLESLGEYTVTASYAGGTQSEIISTENRTGSVTPVTVEQVHGIPGYEALTEKLDLKEYYTDPDGDELKFTLPDEGVPGVQLIGDSVLTVDYVQDLEDVSDFEVTVFDGKESNQIPVTINRTEFESQMAQNRFTPEEAPSVKLYQKNEVRISMAGESLDWYKSVRERHEELPEFKDILASYYEVAIVNKIGDAMDIDAPSYEEAEGGITIYVTIPEITGDETVELFISHNDNEPVFEEKYDFEDTAPSFVEGLSTNANSYWFNDLPVIGGKSIPLKNMIADLDKAPEKLVKDVDDNDKLTYSVTLSNNITLDGSTAGSEVNVKPNAPMNLMLTGVGEGKTEVTLTATDKAGKSVSYAWKLEIKSLSLLVLIIVLSLLALLILIMILLHVTRPVFAGRRLQIDEQNNNMINLEDFWKDGITFAQAAIYTGRIPGTELTMSDLAEITLKPARKNRFILMMDPKMGVKVTNERATIDTKKKTILEPGVYFLRKNQEVLKFKVE